MENSTLKDLISKGENQQLAFLSVLNFEQIARILCSFLNAKSGTVLVGIDGSGDIVGIADNSNVQDLKAYLIHHIVPEAPIDILSEKINNKLVLIIKVWEGSRQPYIFDGNIYYRRGSETQKATSKEIAVLIHGRQESELHWERQISFGVEWGDIDQKLVKRVMDDSKRNHRSSYSDDDLIGFLSHYGLYSNGSFTNACVILFAKKPFRFLPQARVRLTEYSEKKTDKTLIRDEVLEGNLFSIRERLEKYIQNLGIKSVFDASHWRRVDFAYPEKALQEGIINALIHRDYSRFSSQMTLSVYPDKLVIANSGKLPFKEAELKKSHRSFPFNPDIAHIVFLVGYIDKLGRGTIKILEDCKDAGLPTPVWKNARDEVILTFSGPRVGTDTVNTPSDDAVSGLDDAVSKKISDTVIDAVNDAVSDAVKNRLVLVVKILFTNGPVTLKDLTDRLGLSRATVQRDLLLLNSHHLLKLLGSDKFRQYDLDDAVRSKFDALDKTVL